LLALNYSLGALRAFIRLTAILGGFELVSDPSGTKSALLLKGLSSSPFPNYFIPGLIVLIVIAVGNRMAAAGVIAGKACTAYPAVGPDVRTAGGKWVDVPVDKAHVDGKLVTAPAWPAHPEWLAKFLTVLGTKIEP
jgi:hypothetical protein